MSLSFRTLALSSDRKLAESKFQEQIQIMGEQKSACDREKSTLKVQLEGMQARAESAEKALQELTSLKSSQDADHKVLVLRQTRTSADLDDAKARIQQLEIAAQQSEHLLDREKNAHIDAARGALDLQTQVARMNSSLTFQTMQLEDSLKHLDEGEALRC